MTISRVTIRTVVNGLPEGGSAQSEFTMTNTTGVRVTSETTFGVGISAATSFRSPADAKCVTIVMPTTNTNGWRLANSTSETGIAMSSRGASVVSLPPSTVGTEYFGYTSSTRAISGVRLIFL